MWIETIHWQGTEQKTKRLIQLEGRWIVMVAHAGSQRCLLESPRSLYRLGKKKWWSFFPVRAWQVWIVLKCRQILVQHTIFREKWSIPFQHRPLSCWGLSGLSSSSLPLQSICAHFETLTDVKVLRKMEVGMEEHGRALTDFFNLKSTNDKVRAVLPGFHGTPRSILQLLMAHFKEEMDALFIEADVCMNLNIAFNLIISCCI